MMYRVSFENHFLSNETYFLRLMDDFTSIRMLKPLEMSWHSSVVCAMICVGRD